MPVIKTYEQKTSAPGPISQANYSAEQFGAAQGRALQVAGGAVQDTAQMVARQIDRENTSDITARVTKANADLALDLQETIRTSQPGDKKAFEAYNKRVEDTFGKIGEEAETHGAQTFFNEASERIKGQLYKTANDGEAELAGIKAVNDYQGTLNNISSVVLADPSSVDLQREIHGVAIDNLVSSGQLPASKAMELRRQGESALAKATVRGWANLNPGYAKEKLKSGEYDSQLGAEGKLQLQGEIDQAIRGKEIDAERRRIEGERMKTVQQKQIQNDFLQAMTENKLTSKDILNSDLEAFGSGSKEQFLNMLEVANSPEKALKSNGTLVTNLFDRIHLPDGDPNKITDENELNKHFGRGLGKDYLNTLRDEIQGSQTAEGKIENEMKKSVLDIAKGKLTRSNPLTGLKDPEGDEQFARYQMYFYSTFKEQRAKGVPARDLVNPDSPNYLGKTIGTYVRDDKQILRSLSQRRSATPAGGGLATSSISTAGATPPTQAPKANARLPGESAPDYLKRIKAAK